jgi:site-specific DNA-adenine methylase
MLKNYIQNFTNSELVDFIKDLKKNEKNLTNLLEYSKNFRYLLSQVREEKEISLQDFIGNLEYDIKSELFDRINTKKIIIY